MTKRELEAMVLSLQAENVRLMEWATAEIAKHDQHRKKAGKNCVGGIESALRGNAYARPINNGRLTSYCGLISANEKMLSISSSIFLSLLVSVDNRVDTFFIKLIIALLSIDSFRILICVAQPSSLNKANLSAVGQLFGICTFFNSLSVASMVFISSFRSLL